MGENLPRQLIIDEHRDIADAALARDADRAAMLLGRHMVITSDFYARVLSAKDHPTDVGTDAVSPELAYHKTLVARKRRTTNAGFYFH